MKSPHEGLRLWPLIVRLFLERHFGQGEVVEPRERQQFVGRKF
jgi:hypothetical protein